MRFKQKSRI